jgi:hypothetical protein
MEKEVMFGSYGMSVIISAFMAWVFSMWAPSDKVKNGVVVGFGMAIGILALLFFSLPLSIQNIVVYLLHGFFAGMGAIGLWKTLGIQVSNRP